MKKAFLFFTFCSFFLSLLYPTRSDAGWIQTSVNIRMDTCLCLAVNGTNIFAGTYGGGVFLSTDNGMSWTGVSTGLTDSLVNTLAVSPNGAGGANIFAGTEGGGVFLSTNNGTNWTAVNSGLTSSLIRALFVSGTNLYAGTEDDGAFLSTDNGTSWTAVDSGLTVNLVDAFAVNGTNLYAGTDGGAFLSTHNGTSWTDVSSGLTNLNVYAFAFSGASLYAGTHGGGTFLSTNDGTSWTNLTYDFNGNNPNVYAFAVSGTNLPAGQASLFAATYGGVFLSTNNGTSWTAVSSGLSDASVNALALSGTNLFVGTEGSGVWKRPLSQMVTSVNQAPTGLPEKFALYQNYPNPFNPTTEISYQLSAVSNVTLKIHDILGREVTALVNEKQEPGSYSMTFDGSRLASGLYFYRLVAGNYSATKRLVLMK